MTIDFLSVSTWLILFIAGVLVGVRLMKGK
jgi:hypothetical protein